MIETERLTLRPYLAGDFEPYWSMLSELAPQFPSREPISVEDAWRRIMAAVGHWSLFGYGVFAITDKATGEYIGETGLIHQHRELGDQFHGRDEAGWYLAARARGRGLGIEAARAAHDWHGLRFDKRATFCIVDRFNTPSSNLACKLGYRPHATLNCGGGDLILFQRVPHRSERATRARAVFNEARGPKKKYAFPPSVTAKATSH
jgi:RimJ/RimL family protein N-acetyltransferase